MKLTLALAAALLASPAAAPRSLGEDAPEAAEMRYKLGIQLYRSKHFAEAAREFQVAWELYPKSARLAFNLGRCEERAENIEAALQAYEAYLKLAPEADDRPTVEATMAALRKRLQASWPKVTVASVPPGATVSVNGRAQPGSTPVVLRLEPGSHIVGLVLEGHGAASRTVLVEAGRATAVSVPLTATGAAPAAASPATEVRETTPAGASSSLRPWAWTALGVGAAGVVAGGVFTALAVSSKEAAEESETTAESRAALEDKQKTANRDAILMQVGFGVGVAGLATGVTLWFLEDEPVSAGVLPGGGFVRVRF